MTGGAVVTRPPCQARSCERDTFQRDIGRRDRKIFRGYFQGMLGVVRVADAATMHDFLC